MNSWGQWSSWALPLLGPLFFPCSADNWTLSFSNTFPLCFPETTGFHPGHYRKADQQQILLLGIYPREYKSGYNKDTCIPMFIAALFTIDKLWGNIQDAPLLMNRLRKCGKYLFIKKTEILSFAV
jgi:hypothetical protein